LEKIYKNSPIIFKVVFDKLFRNNLYENIIYNKHEIDENKNVLDLYNFSLKQKIEISNRTTKYLLDSIDHLSGEDNYISNYFLSYFYKNVSYFFGILAGANIFLIASIKNQINYTFPYKSNELFVAKMKRIIQLKKILFCFLIIYEAGFGFIIYKSYFEQININNTILPKLEEELKIKNYSANQKYEDLFMDTDSNNRK